MRRAPAHHVTGRPVVELNMTPMIDVVFLLIIFFLVSSNLSKNESRVEVDLPEASTGEASGQEDVALVVNVTAGGETTLGALRVTPAELLERLRDATAERGAPPRVRLRGDRAAPYAAVEPALAACAEAGITAIDLGVRGR
ncbi:MAG: ExbD/TolR family protein [Lacipirellulaceae bacterium]